VKILIKKTGGFTITKLTLSEKITTTCDYLKKYDVTQEADIRKFFHTILENRHFVTDPRTLERENQNGPLETPVPREKTHKSGKSGSIPAKNGLLTSPSPVGV
jgi:hypothetical protein